MHIKRQIKSIVPEQIKTFIKYSKLNFQNNNVPIAQTFTSFYNLHYWNSSESVSGVGSEITNTRTLVAELEPLFIKLEIKSILDIPCGDFNWMRTLNLNGISYIGADIVNDLVEENKEKYQAENIKFKTLDLTRDNLPTVDLILCRDCLVHLSYNNIYNALKNIKKSNSRYILTTSFVNHSSNRNIVTGNWRKLNLQKSPFYLNKPILIINENFTKSGEINGDKSMCLWEINNLKTPLLLKFFGWFTN